MALTKRNYVSGETVITADNLNAIQDELIRVAGLLGKDGVTPHIGDNGNWYIGSTDTGKPSKGEQGPGAEVFYIDLAGSYPKYTCPVAMTDIKAAYEAGKVLECRCTIDPYPATLPPSIPIPSAAYEAGKVLECRRTIDPYLATLPLFIPIPSANTWIFSGSGALTAMNFPAQSLTIAIVKGVVQVNNTRLASTDDIPVIPTVLPNPHALTIKIGSTIVTYDGSSVQNVEIADGSEVSY